MSITDTLVALTEQRDRLRAALAALVGAVTTQELQAMASAIRLFPIAEDDKGSMLTAIQVLLDTATD